jgi:glycosyltransferase involved in cell wall biosynthesis
MRIVQIARDWAINGGLAGYVRDLVAALESAGHEVVVIHADSAPPDGSAHRLYRVPGFADFAHGSEAEDQARRVIEILERVSPDVVHIQCNENFALERALRKRHHVVKTLHVFDFCPTGNKFHFAINRPCRHPTSRLCLPRMVYKRCTRDKRPHVLWRLYRRAADENAGRAGYPAILVASDYVRRQAIASGYAADQVRTLPYFTRIPPTVPGPPQHADRVLFCGRLAPEKGLDLLLRAAARLGRSVRLIVAGDGMERRSSERLARRLGIAANVTFLGWTDRDALAALYDEATAVVVPSRWPEPFGIVGIEAMMHARPVVAFDVGGIPEWLDDGVTGFLVPPYDVDALADRLRACLESPELARALGARGRARVEAEFTAARHVERLMTVYRDVRREWRPGGRS